MEEKELETVEKTEEELINEEFEQEQTEQKVEPTTVVQVNI